MTSLRADRECARGCAGLGAGVGSRMFDVADMPDEGVADRRPATFAFDRRSAITPRRVATDPLKRLFDILASGIGLALFLPLLVMVMVAIRLDTPGPAIFRQRRTGYRGRVFT